MCLREKKCMLDKVYSDMTYSAGSCDFNVNESIIYIK